MPDDPSLANPNSLMPMMPAQQQAPIPQGPTVQAAPVSTNSLADIANLAIPALVGVAAAHSRGQSGLLGGFAGAGKGADAMIEQRVRAQQYQDALDQRRYKQDAAEQAHENLMESKQKNLEIKKKIAFRDQTLATITDPAEKELLMTNPEAWAKTQMIKATKPGDVAFIVKASKGKLDSADVSAMSDETRHALAVDLAKGIGQGNSYSAVKVPLDPEKGTFTWMIQDQKGNAKFLPVRDIQGGPDEPDEKGQTDAQKIKSAEMLGAQWEKQAAQHRTAATLTPSTADAIIDPDRWAKENPKGEWITKQIDLLHKVALKKDKQADKQVEADTKATDAKFDFSDGDTKKAFEQIKEKYPKMTVQEMVAFYEANGGKVP